MFRYLRAMFRNTVVHDYIVILANIHIKLVWNFHGCWKLVNKNLKIKNYKSISSLNTSISHTIIHICCVISKLSYENRPSFPRYGWLNAKIDCAYQSLAFNFDSIYSWEREGNKGIIIESFVSELALRYLVLSPESNISQARIQQGASPSLP